MNRTLLLFCAATLPLFLMAVVVQEIRYQDLRQEVAAMENQQRRAIERHRNTLAGVTVLRAPARIEDLAQQDPGLESVGADRTLKVRFVGEEGEEQRPEENP